MDCTNLLLGTHTGWAGNLPAKSGQVGFTSGNGPDDETRPASSDTEQNSS